MVDYQEIDQLLDDVAQVWKTTHDRSLDVDSLKNDPVTRLLMSAVLNQTDKIESEIDRFHESLIGKLIERYPSQYGMLPVPAIGMVQTHRSHAKGLMDKNPTKIDGSTTFCFSKSGKDLYFMPLLNMTAFDLSVNSVNRIGDNRWLVELVGGDICSDIRGLSICLPNVMCERIVMHIGSNTIDFCNINDFDRLPFVEWFQDADQMTTLLNIYDRLCTLRCSYGVVCDGFDKQMLSYSDGKLSFCIEVLGLSNDLFLSKENILINCVPVCNMVVHGASVTRQDKEKGNLRMDPQVVLNEGEFFLGISSRTSPEGMREHIALRDVGTNRLEEYSNHISELVNLYDSDYCFLNSVMDSKSNAYLREFANILKNVKIEKGKYIVPINPEKLFSKSNETVEVKWFSTEGSLANGIPKGSKLNSNTTQLDKSDGAVLLTSTYGGRNELLGSEERNDILKYHLQTGDRIVSSTDIRLFCQTKLLELFSIKIDVSAIKLENRIVENGDGFKEKVLTVVITLSDTKIDPFQIQSTLERAIRSRLPFDSRIKIDIRQDPNA